MFKTRNQHQRITKSMKMKIKEENEKSGKWK